MPAGSDLRTAPAGPAAPAEDQRLVGAFAAQAAVVLDHIRLSRPAAEAAPLAEANKVRTALLAAVGHDFRTPLAAAKAAVSTLLSWDIDLVADDRRELLAGRGHLAGPAGRTRRQPAGHEPAAGRGDVDRPAAHRGRRGRRARPRRPRRRTGERVLIDPADDLPLVRADPGLLERVLVNLATNALRYSPAEAPPHLTCSRLGDRVEIRVIDRGPGIPRDHWDQIFLPFQRLGDTDNTTGIGLGLALSRGLTEAMGGTLEPEETPGGGLTMVVSLPAAPEDAAGLPRTPRARRGTHDDPRARRRRRAPAPPGARHQPARPALRGARRGVGRRGARGRRPPTRRTWSSSTSACPTWTAPRSSRASGAGPTSRSWCCPAAPTASTRSTPSTPAPTTTSPSRSAWTSCSPGCAP